MAEYQYFTQLFSGGVNNDFDAAALDLSQQNNTLATIYYSQNFIFERGLAVLRSGLGALPGPPSSLPSTANLRAVKMLPLAPRNLRTPTNQRAAFAITDAPALYALQGNQAAGTVMSPTQITGAGFTQSSGYYCDSTLANGVVLIAGNSAGLIRWDPSGTTYTILTKSPYQYVAGHLARAVAAFDLASSTAGYAQTVAWSVSGDETKWDPATNIGAGLTILSECADSITGLKVIKGIVVVARTYGFSIGVPTGQFPAVYDWRKLSDMSIGVMHPASLVAYKDMLFFASESGIHTFDLTEVEDIGEGIYKELIALVRQYKLQIRGFMSPGYNPDFQPTYNIILESGASLSSVPAGYIPHYMFNLRERKWSRHFYGFSDATAWPPLAMSYEYLPTSGMDPAAVPFMAVYKRVAGSSPVPYQWLPGTAAESAANLVTGLLTFGNAAQEVQLERALLIFWADTSASGVTISIFVTGLLDGSVVTQATQVKSNPTAGWNRVWANLRLSGNMFQFQINIAANTANDVKIKALVAEYTVTGKLRS